MTPRSRRVLAALVVGVVCAASTSMVGCYDSDLCEFVTCQGSPTSSTGNVVETRCNPLEDAYAPDASCGVFVREGASGAGTPDDPMGSIADALATGRTTVFVCEGTYGGSLSLPDGTTIFGGLSCSDWRRVPGTRSRVEGVPDEAAVGILSGATATIHGLEIVAADAVSNVGKHGASSIGVFARLGSVGRLVDCAIVAGRGAPGLAGLDHPPDVVTTAQGGTQGAEGCVSAAVLLGADGGPGSCNATEVAGGRGGTGDKDTAGGNGEAGAPKETGGPGGAGATTMNACEPGERGDNGQHGTAGGAANGTGSVDDLGYVPPSARDASGGLPGRGGGGGGGARNCGVSGFAGPSGGGGGAGGCGGAGGGSGGSGGASIGVLAVSASITLESSSVTAGQGGPGGKGGRGAQGQRGGLGGGAGTVASGGLNAPSCPGGPGGDGGQGGPGAGGDGGFSVGVLFVGAPPTLVSTMIVGGTAGEPGEGAQNEGANFEKGPSGAQGLTCASVAVGDTRACAQ